MEHLSKGTLFLFICCICLCNYGYSQKREHTKDSSQTIYEKAETLSKKSKFAGFLHRLIIRSPKRSGAKSAQVQNQVYKPYEGKIIRKIRVKSHDPFGFSITDSTKKATKWIERAGNDLHTKSKEFAIKNFLILKENTPLDSLELIESERLVRSQKFIRSVEITVEAVGKNRDSVDVYVTTLDSWSLVLDGAVSNSELKLRATEQNFLGFGHELRVANKNRFSDGKTVNDIRYSIPNMKNTYITSTIGFNQDLDDSYSKYFNIRRPFFSPLTKWAAGIYSDEQFVRKELPDADMLWSSQDFKYRSQDIWAGYAFRILKGNSERERTTNLISALRWINVDYREKPAQQYDSINYFSNETFYLGSIGISSRQFVEDKYIFRDGIIENVPIGDIYGITFGKRIKNNQNRFYIGAKIARGNYFSWGYLSASLEYGTFLHGSISEQTAYTFTANYFTKLLDIGNSWKMRQFIKPQFIVGKNRLNSVGDRVTIDETNDFQGRYGTDSQRHNNFGIPGFDSGLYGTSKCVIAYQTQFYPPWNVIGFRFNPFININTAMLGNEESRFSDGKLYTSFSVGFIIRNDYLVFNSLQLSLNFYPTIPGQGNNILKTNVLNTDDFGLRGFQLGKPSPIWYN